MAMSGAVRWCTDETFYSSVKMTQEGHTHTRTRVRALNDISDSQQQIPAQSDHYYILLDLSQPKQPNQLARHYARECVCVCVYECVRVCGFRHLPCAWEEVQL